MAYYVAVETANNHYLGIDIKRSGFFGTEMAYKEEAKCTLEEIDTYTTKYLNEEHLKKSLLSERILSKKYKTCPLAIVYVPEKGKEQVVGTLLYKDYKEYLKNPYLVVEYITRKVKELDFEFLKELEKILASNLTTKDSSLDISKLLDGDMTIIESIKKLLNANQTENTESEQINHNNLRMLVQLISDYESLNKKENKEIKVRKK